jgi:hypothetical protein
LSTRWPAPLGAAAISYQPAQKAPLEKPAAAPINMALTHRPSAGFVIVVRISIYQIGAVGERGKPRLHVVNKVQVVASGTVEHVGPLYGHNIPAKEGVCAGRKCWWDLFHFNFVCVFRVPPRAGGSRERGKKG